MCRKARLLAKCPGCAPSRSLRSGGKKLVASALALAVQHQVGAIGGVAPTRPFVRLPVNWLADNRRRSVVGLVLVANVVIDLIARSSAGSDRRRRRCASRHFGQAHRQASGVCSCSGAAVLQRPTRESNPELKRLCRPPHDRRDVGQDQLGMVARRGADPRWPGLCFPAGCRAARVVASPALGHVRQGVGVTDRARTG